MASQFHRKDFVMDPIRLFEDDWLTDSPVSQDGTSNDGEKRRSVLWPLACVAILFVVGLLAAGLRHGRVVEVVSSTRPPARSHEIRLI
jgi:hypothetical protein